MPRSVGGVIRPLSRTALVLDIVGAALLFVILTPFSVAFYGPGASGVGVDGAAVAAVIVAGLLMCGGVAIGRLAPALALVAAWAGAIVQMLSGFGPLPIDVAILLVLYATKGRHPGWIGLLVAAVLAWLGQSGA